MFGSGSMEEGWNAPMNQKGSPIPGLKDTSGIQARIGDKCIVTTGGKEYKAEIVWNESMCCASFKYSEGVNPYPIPKGTRFKIEIQ